MRFDDGSYSPSGDPEIERAMLPVGDGRHFSVSTAILGLNSFTRIDYVIYEPQYQAVLTGILSGNRSIEKCRAR